VTNKREEKERTRQEESARTLSGIGDESGIGGFTEASVKRNLHAMGVGGTADNQGDNPPEMSAADHREAELEAMAQKWGKRLAYLGIIALILFTLSNFGVI